MNTKKIACIATFIFTALTSANFASAVDWTPLVRIPGLPATGSVDLSMYMVGLYDFLLSIVGIVAVMMLIIGGMRYITAAGNSAAIGDAKDIITNAIVGLLLALLSWVFIATINPDVLYIKQPGSSFTNSPVSGACYKEYDDTLFTCKCIDDFVALNPPYADATACDDECRTTNHCGLDSPNVCIAPGSPNDSSSLNFNREPYNGKCQCLDKCFYPIGGFTSCQDMCATLIAGVYSPCIKLSLSVSSDDFDVYAKAIETSLAENMDITNVKAFSTLTLKTTLNDPLNQMVPNYIYTYRYTNCIDNNNNVPLAVTYTVTRPEKDNTVFTTRPFNYVTVDSPPTADYCWLDATVVSGILLADSGSIKVQVSSGDWHDFCKENADCESLNCNAATEKCEL